LPKTFGGNSKISFSIETAEGAARVKVEALGHLRELTGKKELEVELAIPTIEELIRSLSSRYGENFTRAVVDSDSGELQVLILVNGKDIDFLQKLRTPLRNGDRVAIIPHVGGG